MIIAGEPFLWPNIKTELFETGIFIHEVAKKVANIAIESMLALDEPVKIKATVLFCYDDCSELALLDCSALSEDDFRLEAMEMHRHIFLKRRDCRTVAITYCAVAQIPNEKDPFQILQTYVLTGKETCAMITSATSLMRTFELGPGCMDYSEIPNSVGLGLINACLKRNNELYKKTRCSPKPKKNNLSEIPASYLDFLNKHYSFEYVGKIKGYRITSCRVCGVDKIAIPNEYDDGVHGVLKVKSIGESSFASTSAKSIILPNTIVEIEENAFEDCSFTAFVIPNSVKRIGFEAFDSCESLKKITIGKGVKKLDNPFSSCEKLKNIYYKGTVEQWESLSSGVFFDCECVVHCSDGETTTD